MVDHTAVTAASRPVLADRYELGDIIGRGGVADVFGATDRTLGRTVAVKLFRHDDHTPPDTRRVDSEMRTLALLSHPGLVTLFDAGTASDVAGYGGPYLVMELVDGPTLGSFRGGRALTLPATARIGRELADALASMHAAGVVHRDIKPANVLMTRQSSDPSARWTKLTDFGIARLVDSERLTEHGTSVGTAHYVSPEQAMGTVAEPASDVYSLGLVLIECITGRMVFEGSAVASAVARLHRDPAVPGDLGPAWASLLRDMTNRDAAERPDAREVSRRLDALTAPTDLADDTDVLVPPLPVARVADAVTEDFRHTRRPSSTWILAAGAGAAA
ncbi:MAG: serine/threonine-protein kinase, partial [Rhodococcus sp. (in: high G+C Gram-positive bacteria)]